MGGKVALLWLSQIALPSALALYVLFQSRAGSPPSDMIELAAKGAWLWMLITPGVLIASRANRPILLRASVSLWVVTMTFSIMLCSLRLAGVRSDIPLTVWRVKRALAGKDEGSDVLGIYAAHPRYGWSIVPGSAGRHEFVDFDVVYTIDNEGFRVTDSPPGANAAVLCLGCSFTFGHGVADNEPYPAILGRQYWTDVKVRNGGVNGWGTAQAFLFAEDYLANHEAPALVLYGWVPYHLERNYRRKSWLEFLAKFDRKNPSFEIENDRLCFRGLAGPEVGLPLSPALRSTEADLSARLLIGLGETFRQHGSRFVVALLPSKYPNPETAALTDGIAAELHRKGLEWIDLRQCTQGQSRERLYFAHDPHPQPIWHELIVRSLAAAIVPGGQQSAGAASFGGTRPRSGEAPHTTFRAMKPAGQKPS
jgi:hypothetical protein